MSSGISRVDLSQVKFTKELLDCITSPIAYKYRVLPVASSPAGISVAMREPIDSDVVDSLTHLLRAEVFPCIADATQIETLLPALYTLPPRDDRDWVYPVIPPSMSSTIQDLENLGAGVFLTDKGIDSRVTEADLWRAFEEPVVIWVHGASFDDSRLERLITASRRFPHIRRFRFTSTGLTPTGVRHLYEIWPSVPIEGVTL
jgi:hypothetical protein